MKEKVSIIEYQRKRAYVALALGILTIIGVFVGVMMQIVNVEAATGNFGVATYKLFTVNSNVMAAVGIALYIPYCVDGIRNRNYHLPRWVMNIQYMGVINTTVTVTAAITVISMTESFYVAMIQGNSILLHALCPLMFIIMFVFINTDRTISRRMHVIGLIPAACYMTVYFTMVAIVGADHGGWEDFYHVAEFVPIWVSAIAAALAFWGISLLLRFLHNTMHRFVESKGREHYRHFVESSFDSIEEAVACLAAGSLTVKDRRSDLSIPRRMLWILKEEYDSELSDDQLCQLYVKEYYKSHP